MSYDMGSSVRGFSNERQGKDGKAPKRKCCSKKEWLYQAIAEGQSKEGVLICAESACSVKNKVRAVCDRIWKKKLEM